MHFLLPPQQAKILLSNFHVEVDKKVWDIVET